MQRFGILALACMCTTGAAHAGFSIEGTPTVSSDRSILGERTPYQGEARASFKSSGSKLEPRQARYQDAVLVVDLAYKPVTQKGSGHADRVDGFADDVPFATAISMILPTGWQLYQAKELAKSDVPVTVSYIGGKAWPDVLEQLGERYMLKFHVDWYDRTVMMSKGRPSPVHHASRIRIIAEPQPAPKKTPAAVTTVAKAESAVPSGVKDGKAIQASSESKSTLPRPVLKSEAQAPKTVAGEKSAAVTPVAVTTPPMMTMQIRGGTLHENVVRLSKENGWAAPAWHIDGDYRIPAPYSIQAKDFAEAMVKLLMLHPIEADVNTAQRKIYVLKETR
ncbi:hypothetical protein [Stutzerimonas stutzeri]|uniref:hypothetical protein n=1 Tax=Stutzerimonas stutzeri TaxID=316 RepID=UPI00265D3D36|nr:hypothetical protein [Stutzerimonas stutzeri]MCF6783435.1 toxin co-regulated pilus biosynthesis Q family protein [Stutzerimonas stutzeri]